MNNRIPLLKTQLEAGSIIACLWLLVEHPDLAFCKVIDTSVEICIS